MKRKPRAGRLVSRRQFLALSAAASLAAPNIVNAATIGRGAPGANDRIGIGVIGAGDRGNDHVRTLLGRAQARIVGVCDPYLSKCEEQAAHVNAAYGSNDCVMCQDFRDLIARDDVDAVFIASPEHWHGVQAVAALEAGKDVYGEKALALTVAEGRAVVDAARRHGRVFQVGLQQRSARDFRFACELARNGYLGRLHTVRVGVPAGNTELPEAEPTAPPPDLDYDAWLGPAPYTPHNDLKCTYNWYFMTDYCAGWIQSWGVHHIDIAQWGAPSLTRGSFTVKGAAEFPKTGLRDTSTEWALEYRTNDGVLMIFTDNGKQPQGCRFEGDEGWVLVNRAGIWAEPASLLTVRINPGEQRLYRSEDHWDDFLSCVRSRHDPAAPVESGHTSNVITLAGDIAARMKRELTWDWDAETFTDCEEANRRISRTMRPPWRV